MLNFLSVNNFTLVEAQQLELQKQMTVITGETGAGKSVMLQALGLALGDRADAKQIRASNGQFEKGHGESGRVEKQRAEIQAEFDISTLPQAQAWLEQRELNTEENLCLLRRTLSAEGRSRAWVNGQAITLAELRELAQHLITIHSQHAHQALLQTAHHAELLDAFVDPPLLVKTRALASEWLEKNKRFNILNGDNKEQQARADFLQFQLNELAEADLKQGEYEELSAEQKMLANAESLLGDLQQALQINNDDDGVVSQLHKVSALIDRNIDTSTEQPGGSDEKLKSASELLASALIQIGEASSDIENFLNGFSQDPERLNYLDTRISLLYELARKHRCKPEELPQLEQDLQNELQSISADDATLEKLQKELEALQTDWKKQAEKLSKQRKKASKTLSDKVNGKLKELMMEHCEFAVAFKIREKQQPHVSGLESVEFLVSTNPGQAAGSLNKIASGGELSRISLAIQVITAEQAKTPTLVFDEVDVGIGGAVAEVVGKLLKELAANAQVLCVTHLPQVAAFGQQHINVAKKTSAGETFSELQTLNEKQRLEELARMLGGKTITAKTRAHAEEMLANAS